METCRARWSQADAHRAAAPPGPRRRGRIGAAALVLALAACGGGGGGGGDSAVSPSPPAPGPAPAPAPIAPYTVSGALSVTETSAIDSDTNDPNQADRRDNGSFQTVQPLANPVQLVGYVAMPGGAEPGPLSPGGDLVDGFQLDLEAGQVVELEFSANPSRYDIDLVVYDGQQRPVGYSIGVNQFECVRISTSGRYVVAVQTYAPTSSGSSVYQLRIGQPGSSAGCSNATGAAERLLANRILARTADGPAAVAKAAADAVGVRVLDGQAEPGRLHLVEPLPAAVRTAAARRLADEARAIKGSGRIGDETVEKAVQAGIDAWRRGLPAESIAVLETIDQAKLMVASGRYAFAMIDHRVVASQTTTLPTLPSNDRDYARQRWHYEAIGLPQAFATLRGVDPATTRTPIVAVVDTGVVSDHPDLRNQLVDGYDMVSNADDAGDGDGRDRNPDDASASPGASFHGTHVAGTVAAESGNGIGVVGVAPIARIMPVRVLGVEGSGSLIDILQGVRYAAGLDNNTGVRPARAADVINLSLGAEGLPCDGDLLRQFNEVQAAGVLVVAAAGNESTASTLAPVGFPANCPSVLAVTATDARGSRARYSNGGPEAAIAAPGGDVSQTTTGNGQPDGIYSTLASLSNRVRTPSYGALQGTSMAAPHVAGVLALMRYVNPTLTPQAVATLLRDGRLTDELGPAGRDAQFGYGLINARKAVEAALAARGGPTPPAVGAVEVQPSSLGLGALRSSADLTIAAVGTTTEQVASVTSDSAVIAVQPVSVDPTTRLGSYRVVPDRSGIAPGATVFANVIVQLVPARTIQVPVTVSRAAAAGAGGSLGPAYVLAVDAADPNRAVVGQATVVAPTGGVYRYTINVPGTRSISIIAGNDLDNDGYICGPGEACGAWPTLSAELQVLQPTGNLTGIDFALLPIGGVQASAAATATGVATGVAKPAGAKSYAAKPGVAR